MTDLRASRFVWVVLLLLAMSGRVRASPVDQAGPREPSGEELSAGSGTEILAETPVPFERFHDSRARLGFVYNGIGSSDLKNQPIPGIDDVAVWTTALDAELALLIAPLDRHGSTLAFDACSRWLILTFSNVPVARAIERFDRHLYVGLGTTYRGWFAAPWGVQARFSAGVASTLEEQYYDSDWWVFQGGIWLLRSFRSGLAAGIGAVYTFDFGSPMWLPSLLLEYERKPYHLDVNLPERAAFWYEILDGLRAGVVCRVWGMRYARDRLEFPELPRLIDPHLGHSALTLGASVEYVFDNRLRLAVEGGYSLNRYLRIVDRSFGVLNLDPENGPFLRATASLGGGL